MKFSILIGIFSLGVSFTLYLSISLPLTLPPSTSLSLSLSFSWYLPLVLSLSRYLCDIFVIDAIAWIDSRTILFSEMQYIRRLSIHHRRIVTCFKITIIINCLQCSSVYYGTILQQIDKRTTPLRRRRRRWRWTKKFVVLESARSNLWGQMQTHSPFTFGSDMIFLSLSRFF